MGGAVISNLDDVYNEMLMISHRQQDYGESMVCTDDDSDEDDGDEPIGPSTQVLDSKIDLFNKRELITRIKVKGKHYAVSMGIVGATEDFKNFPEYFETEYTKHLKKQKEIQRGYKERTEVEYTIESDPFTFKIQNPELLGIERESDAGWAYQARLNETSTGSSLLRICCGEEGQMQREIENIETVQKNLIELGKLGNLFLEEWITQGVNKNHIYSINFKF